MQRYIVLINFTEKGMKRIKNLPERVNAARKAIESSGGKFIDWNLTMGIYDSVAIIELPDDAKIASIILGTGKKGFIKTTTLKAFSESEAEKIVNQIS
ncbi:MAG: GYD domain-containing protein [Candidatus Bathyarchaeota archaeon]